ncbi:hypothetical protein B0H14DRAFT_3495514 [Mycena olivaceomarginata]|nr:hypothetical protein B0H14DRAFT_3495514 [Mycena olivaceomarginata]
MPNTRSSTRNAAMVPAANTSSERHTAASRSPTRSARVKPSRKKRSTKKTAPGEVPAPTEVLEAVPSNGEPEGNNKVIDTASTEIVVAVPSNDEPEVNEKDIDTAPAKAPEAVPGDDGPEDDEETIDSDAGGRDGSRPRPSPVNSPLPPSSSPPASSSPLVSPAKSPLPPSVSPPVPTRPLPRRQLPRSKTVPRPATGDVNDDIFSLAHRRVPRRRSVSSEPQPDSDSLWKSVGSELQLNSDNLDESGIGRQGQWERLDDHNCANVDDAHMGDEGSEEDASQFADHTTVGYYDYDDMGEALPPPRRTWPSLSARPSRSLSPLRPLNHCNVAVRARSPVLTPASHLRPELSLVAVRARLAPALPCHRSRPCHGLCTLKMPLSFKLCPPWALRLTHQPAALLLFVPPTPDHQSPNRKLPLPQTHLIVLPLARGTVVAHDLNASHSPSRDLSSDDSTDEYGRTQEAKRRLEAARVARGYSPAAASNADDEDDLQDYLAEVAYPWLQG